MALELPDGVVIRPITPDDDAVVARIIRTVMPEFGAEGPGFAIMDPEVDAMSAAYPPPRSAYFVVEVDGVVRGGAGVGPLAGAPDDTCELRKMYFLREARGRGLGEIMLRHCLATAHRIGYATCYLETLTGMSAAQALYAKLGFARLCKQVGATGHFGCDQYFSKSLRDHEPA